MDISEVVGAIQRGEFSSVELERIQSAIRHRQEDVALQLQHGDRVVTGRNVRPKYLAGRKGTVQSHRGDRIMVLMDECGHYRVSGREWRMTPSSIQRIDEAA